MSQSAAAAPRLLFCHIPKTAGTAARRALQPAFPRHESLYLWNPEHRADLWPEDFARFALTPRIRFIAGHATVRQLMANPVLAAAGPEVVFLSVVRDPVARALSFYNFVRNTPHHRNHADAQSPTYLTAIPGDVQYRFLRALPGATPRWRIIIAPVEALEEACGEALKAVDAGPGGHLAVAQENTASSVVARHGGTILRLEDLDLATLSHLRDANRRDSELYEAVRSAGRLHALPAG